MKIITLMCCIWDIFCRKVQGKSGNIPIVTIPSGRRKNLWDETNYDNFNNIMGQQKEKRKAHRSPVSIRIDYSTVDQFLWNFASNINEGGLFVESNNPLDVGTVVQLKFYLPNIDSPIKATGEVVWTGNNEPDNFGEESGPEKQGMGIRFKNLDEQSKAAINHLVQELRNK